VVIPSFRLLKKIAFPSGERWGSMASKFTEIKFTGISGPKVGFCCPNRELNT
jgi:hypothetical protein